MKTISNLFLILAVLLSDVMCAVVAYNYCDMMWGIKYAGYSAPVSTAFLVAIPFAIAIVVCVVIALYFKKTIMDYIAGKYPDLVPLYDEIYNKHNRSYFEALEVKAEEMAKKYDCPFVDNEMPYGRVPQGHPVIVDYFYHEEIRGTENTGKRNR